MSEGRKLGEGRPSTTPVVDGRGLERGLSWPEKKGTADIHWHTDGRGEGSGLEKTWFKRSWSRKRRLSIGSGLKYTVRGTLAKKLANPREGVKATVPLKEKGGAWNAAQTSSDESAGWGWKLPVCHVNGNFLKQD